MATNVIVAFFKESQNAIDASQKLTEIESSGYLSINEMTLLKKDDLGNVSFLNVESDRGENTLLGMGTGFILGAVAGPVGLLAGSILGTVVGGLVDYKDDHLADDFVKKVQELMLPSTTVLLVEVDEDNTALIDEALQPLNAIVLRTSLERVKTIHKNLKELDKKIASERKKLTKASDSLKEEINETILSYQTERAEIVQQINKDIDQVKN